MNPVQKKRFFVASGNRQGVLPFSSQSALSSSSQNGHSSPVAEPPVASLSPPEQSLFVIDDDEDDEEEQEGPQSAESSSLQNFENEISRSVGQLPESTIQYLYRKYHGKPNEIRQSISEYLKGIDPEEMNGRKRPAEEELDEMYRKMQSESSRIKAEADAQKWRKFIGSVPVQAWATRPTMKPLVYGDSLTLKRMIPKNTSMSDSSIVRLFTSADREIARIPEDLTRIISPLVDLQMAEFDTTILESTRKRLSTGDSFFIQINIYLKDSAFRLITSEDDINLKKFKTKSKTPAKAKSANFNFSAESSNESILRLRQFALAKLFERLTIKPTRTFEEEELEESELPAQLETIDVESSSDIKAPDHVDLDQLKQFYQANNQSNILNNLPDTTTPPAQNFKLALRPYQRHGLSWMLTREKEIDVLEELNLEMSSQTRREIEEREDGMTNPLWRRYRWPRDPEMTPSESTQITQFSSQNSQKYFYANTFNGELSLEKPIIKSSLRGGIIADEMGLGKTISSLALITSVPYDRDMNPTSPNRPYAGKTTLIVVPMSLLSQWQKEFEKCNNNPNHCCFIYYGDSTVSNLGSVLCNKTKDIPIVMLTTYGTIVNEFNRLSKQRDINGELPTTGIYSVEFFRIILDEGHNIRNRNTKSAKSIYEISSKRKWVLTGTPIINRLDDLYSLVKFLQLDPWCNFSYWKTFITLPFEQKKVSQTLEIIKSILDPIFLRRTKNMKQKDGQPIVNLPPKEVIIEEIEFNEREEKLYNWFKSKATKTFREGMKSGQLLKSYTQILTHILRLRQICCHMDLVGGQHEMDQEEEEELAKDVAEETSAELRAFLEDQKGLKLGFTNDTELRQAMYPLYPKINLKDSECSICTNSPINAGEMVVTPCGHSFCFTCLLEHIDFQQQKNGDLRCPNCRCSISKYKLFKLRSKEVTKKEIRFHTQLELDDPSNNYKFQLYWYDPEKTSSKLEALTKHLRNLKTTNPGEKVILFSQFSSYLDIIENELKFSGYDDFEVYKFDGRLHMLERQRVLDQFNEPAKDPSKIVVLLLSLKAGGVGLNLTTASKAFMMDPWWSPSVEDQAIDRIHRIGQNETVKVVRFIMKNSIEIKMLKIQERKKQIGEAVGVEEEERRKRRIEEIQMLFEE